ncbi:hypothetical protein GCM10009798_33560 [Nocardioides panacihumi]|uniref:Tyr recombinase domain-containing protein n=1 Tax=Nocardioides panacihumi TaxID=400774 RepID=A0ABP5CXH8_9ACTN
MNYSRTRNHPSPRQGDGRSSDPGASKALVALVDTLSSHSRGEALSRGMDAANDDDRAAATLDVELVEAELTDGTQISLDANVIDLVLDSYLDDRGRLVPVPVQKAAVPVNGLSDDDAKRLARTRQINDMRSRAWADNTLRAYGSGVRAWRSWCADENVPALPLDPVHVVNHILDLVFVRNGADYLKDDEGNYVTSVVASTVEIRLSALNKLAEFVGLPRPGDNLGVLEVIRGLRRTLGTAPTKRRAALDFALLTRCLEATTGATFAGARLRAAVLLRARTGASVGQLAGLEWADVELSSEVAVISLPPRRKGGQVQRVEVRKHRNKRLCLIEALSQLRRIAPELGPVICRRDGTELSRQAVHLSLSEVCRPAGGFGALARANDRVLASVLESAPTPTALETARDRALLLTGFYTARRRSELEALNWRDLIDHGRDGWEVKIRRSKTDQTGQGHTNWLPQEDEDNPLLCPARAMREYRRLLAKTIGREPSHAEPVFVPLTSGGAVRRARGDRLKRLTADAISDVVTRRAAAAGLVSPAGSGGFGGHSLRAGFVTEALRDGKLSIPEVQEVTGHKSADILLGYSREVNAAKRNGSRRLMEAVRDSRKPT